MIWIITEQAKAATGGQKIVQLVEDLRDDQVENFIWVHGNRLKNMQRDLEEYLPAFKESYFERFSQVIASEFPDADVDIKLVQKRLEQLTYTAPDYLKVIGKMSDSGLGDYLAQSKHIRMLPVGNDWESPLNRAIMVHETTHGIGSVYFLKIHMGEDIHFGTYSTGLSDNDPEKVFIEEGFVQWLTNKIEDRSIEFYQDNVAYIDQLFAEHPGLRTLAIEAHLEADRGTQANNSKYNQFYRALKAVHAMPSDYIKKIKVSSDGRVQYY